MTVSNQALQAQLKQVANVLQSSELASAANQAEFQRLAAETSKLLSAGEIVNGMKSLTQNINHSGSAEVAIGIGIAKLTEAVKGLEQDLRTNIDADAADLTTMTGETVSSAFRKKYYGSTSVEGMNSMLEDAAGKTTQQLVGVMQNFQIPSLSDKVPAGLTTTLTSALTVSQTNFSSLLSTFTSGNIGTVLQDITDKLDTSGNLFTKIGDLAKGLLSDNAITDAIQSIANKDFISATNVIAGVLPDDQYNTIETSVKGYSTQLTNRVTGLETEHSLPPFETGTTQKGYDEPASNTTNPGSSFTMLKSFDELEADLRNASRGITEMIFHWSESGINQFLTAEDLDEIQSGIRYHYVILKDGNIQRGVPINRVGNHIPSQVVAENEFEVQNNPNSLAIQQSVPISYTPPSSTVAAGLHNTYGVGVVIIGGIAAAAGSPEYERYLSASSITTQQWDSIDEMLRTFYKVFPGGQVFGHNDIETNQPDPGFSVPDYAFKKFKKQNIGTDALSPTQLNQATITTFPGAR